MMAIMIQDIEQAARQYSRDARALRNLNEGFNDAVDKIKKTFETQMTDAAKTAAFVKFTDTEVQKIIEAIMQAQSKAAQ